MSIPWHEILWQGTWANNMAAVEWTAAAGLAALLLRKPLARLWHRARRALLAPVHARLDEISRHAAAAHAIAADTHKALTGLDHPQAPSTTEET